MEPPENPYSAPLFDAPGWSPLRDDKDRKPPVLFWFKVYTILMAVMFALLLVIGVGMVGVGATVPQKEPDAKVSVIAVGVAYAVFGLVMTVPFAIAPTLGRKSWVWIFDLVLICVGLSSPCCMPASIPLLIFWIKPETRAYFGRD